MIYTMEDIFRNTGVVVTLPSSDDFLKIKETLTRMGIASRKGNKLFQSCHILHKQGSYAILHFKELFILDGKQTSFDKEDEARRNTIVDLLDQWGLVSVVDPDAIKGPRAPLNQIKIITHKEKNQWVLEPKYSIGKKRGQITR